METSRGLPGRGPTPGVCIMPRRPCSDSAPLRWKPGLRAHLCSQELSGSWMGLGEGCRARDECVGQGYVPTQRSDSPSCPLVGGLEGTAEPCAGGISQAEAPGASGLEQGLLWLAEAGGAGQAPGPAFEETAFCCISGQPLRLYLWPLLQRREGDRYSLMLCRWMQTHSPPLSLVGLLSQGCCEVLGRGCSPLSLRGAWRPHSRAARPQAAGRKPQSLAVGLCLELWGTFTTGQPASSRGRSQARG